MKFLVPKLVRALTRDLFRADIAQHWESFRAFEGREFDYDEADIPFIAGR
jgi:hypothetical protein